MSYHPRVSSAAAPKNGNGTRKTIDAADASRLARLAYRVVLKSDDDIDASRIMRQLTSPAAKEVARAVLGRSGVSADAVEMAERFKEWARRSARIEVPAVK
jgi:hypothetical protein